MIQISEKRRLISCVRSSSNLQENETLPELTRPQVINFLQRNYKTRNFHNSLKNLKKLHTIGKIRVSQKIRKRPLAQKWTRINI